MNPVDQKSPLPIPTLDIAHRDSKKKFSINSYTLAGIITFVIIIGVFGGIFYISSASGTGNSSDQIPESIKSIDTFKNNILGTSTESKVTPTLAVPTPTPTKSPVQSPVVTQAVSPSPASTPTSTPQPTSAPASTSAPTSTPVPTSTPTPTFTPTPTPTPSE